MLLFLIGLELRPRRLWVMRRAVFALGSAQVVECRRAGGAVAARVPWAGASCWAPGWVVLHRDRVPMLAEADLLKSRAGRDGFAVLLFQDLAFIPLVALVPLLADTALPDHVPWHDVRGRRPRSR